MALLLLGLPPAQAGPLATADTAKGKRAYDQYCVPCHGAGGKGDGTRASSEAFDPVPRNHTNGSYMNQRTNDQLFKVIKEGGVSINLSHIMPPWKTILADEEIWDTVAYVRALADPPYTGER